MDFIEAREKRREILNILKQQQADDAICVNQIKEVAIQGKRAVLRAVAEWFTAIRPGQPVTTSTRNAFATITAELTVEDWLKAQADYEIAEVRFQEALESERKADAAYDAVAPWGGISTFFADEAEKRRIEPVKACRDAAERARATAFVGRQTARQQVADHCEQILREASSPEQLQRICGEPDIAQLLAPIIQ
jgi:hypothetical protein